jgi:IS30 family transposase
LVVEVNVESRGDMRHYGHLTARERDGTAELHATRQGVTDIARAMGRDESTVSGELGRNGGRGRYGARTAQGRADERRGARRPRGRPDDPELAGEARRDVVEPHRSPEQMDGRPRLGRGRRTAGLAAIHRAADEGRTDAPGATGSRRVRRRLRREGRTARGGREETRGGTKVPRAISERPAEAGERSRLGDREGDTVVGPGTARPVGIVGRASRLPVGGKAAAHTAEAAGEVEVACLRGRPLETVTPGRGRGSADHEEAGGRLGGARFYFRGPRHPWQKPTVENADGLIREFFPKGTDFSKVTDEEVQRVYELINDRPRKVLGYRTPNEVYREMLHSA